MDVRTQRRVDVVLARTKKLRRRREHRLLEGLSTSCLLLTAGLAWMFGAVNGKMPFGTPITDAFAAVLLHEGAGGYVLVGVLAFAIGAAITIVHLLRRQRH